MSVLYRLARRLQNLVQEYYQPGFVDSPAKTAILLDTEDSLASAYIGMVEDPQVIRTVGELEALDRETWLLGREGDVMSAADWYDYTLFPIDEDDRLAVIATGEQVRAARKALEDAS